MRHESINLNSPCEFINITEINPLISKCQIKVCYIGEEPNRNGTVITKEVATQMAQSLPGSPIVGFFNKETEDFEEHNKVITIKNGQIIFEEETRPYGFVDLGAKCWFQKFLDDGVEHEYLLTEGYLWTGQYPEAQRVIDKGNNQSMELDNEKTSGRWAFLDNEQSQFFIINETIISKLCILGENYEPCFEGASITGALQFSFDDNFNQQMYSMMEAIGDYIKEGGEKMQDPEIIETAEEPVVEEPATEPATDDYTAEEPAVEPKVEDSSEEEPADEPEVTEEQPTTEFSIEDNEQYQQIVADYAAAMAKQNSLEARIAELETENASLTQFKNGIERKRKKQMIESFYMLSDDEKADVVNNIDNYSVDEIEAKLSVICFRNKISFNEPEESDNINERTFNLDSLDVDDTTPAWVKAVLKNS